MSAARRLLLAAALALAPGLASGQGSDPSPGTAPDGAPVEIVLPDEILALEGDPEYGAYLASDCLSCHQADGGTDGIPSITGWPEEAFVTVMHAYKSKLRSNPVMQMMAGRLSDEEIAALAAYFGGLE